VSAKSACVVLLANALLSAVFIAAYALWFAPAQTAVFAVLDVAELYRLKEAQVAAVLVKHEASAEERALALERATAFGLQVNTLIESFMAECRCLVLARGAVVGPAPLLPDLTPQVRRRLGL